MMRVDWQRGKGPRAESGQHRRGVPSCSPVTFGNLLVLLDLDQF
jgi:hypothetical protein